MAANEKIAIVGIGCRFAGGIDNVDEFWKALSEGRDCSSPLPHDRFDVAAFYHPELKKNGRLYCERGGFLKQDVLKFDRQFFKMPPEEAQHLDPQVRLLLEVTLEALEDAGLPPTAVKGSKTGVFMGVTANEYQALNANPTSYISQYTNSGTNSCMVANRISYEFDLNGPSFSVDTACSSSLYSTHLACEAIRRGECDMALAGGVNLLLMPNTFIGFCQAGMLAPDGRCKSFDDSADGYSRGEGAGVIMLKPLDRALADKDRIYAVVRGGALTNDGHTPGIANPSYDAQVELVQRACANAAVAYEEIPYVEAHGTGTQVGDTTEANALGQTIGTARKIRDSPLYIGSVKSNISHCEGSAGVAGIIKTALALHHHQIPPVVHFKRGNDKIKFDEYNLKVPQKLEPWPKGDKALAGVSSFGFGGANAHLILEGVPAGSGNSTPGSRERKMPLVKPLVISAQTKDGLKETAKIWMYHLQNNEDSFHDILSTAALRRQHHGHRLGVLCRSSQDAVTGLQAFVEDSGRTLYLDGHVPDAQAGSTNRLVFVFNGMGTQWFGMGQALLKVEPTFRETILKFDKVMKTFKCSWSVMEQLENSQLKDRIHETEYAQPTICAVQMALTELLKKYDVIPDVVIGHSVGEVAAAYACAKLSFQNAVFVIYERARALKRTSGSGTMLAARVSQQEVEDIRASNSAIFDQVDIAAVNSASQTVLSGTRVALDAFAAVLHDRGVRHTFLKVQNAFHSSQQEPLCKHVHKKFAKLQRNCANADSPSIAMMSTVTREYVSAEEVNSAAYWWRNIRHMVHFKDAIERLLADGYSHFLEIGAHPALMSVIRDVIASSKNKPKKFSVLPTLRRKDDHTSSQDSQFQIMSTLVQLFCEQDVNSLPAVFHERYHVVSLPTYNWQRVECGRYPSLPRELHLFPIHPLLGRKITIPAIAGEDTSRKIIWHQPAASIARIPWIADHLIQGAVVFPAVGYTDMMLEIANELQHSHATGDAKLCVRNLRFEKFLFFPSQGDVELMTIATNVRGSDDKLWTVGVWSKSSSGEWVRHAHGQIDLREDEVDDNNQPATISRGNTLIRLPVEKLRLRCVNDAEANYQPVYDSGFHLGPSFRSGNTLFINDDATEALLYADAPKEILHDFRDFAYHPAFFDGLLHGYIMLVVIGGDMLARRRNEPFHYTTEVPYSFGEVELYGEPAEKIVMYVKLYVKDGVLYTTVRAADATTNIVFCSMTDIRFDPLPDANRNDALHTWSMSWLPFNINDHPRDTGTRADKVLLICDKREDADQLAQAMKREGATEVGWVSTRQLDELPNKCRQLSPNDAVVLYYNLPEEDCSKMKAAHFIKFMEENCMNAASILVKIKNAFPDGPPKMWMVTRGAAYVQTGDNPRPCLNTIQSVALTAVHEFYLNPTSSVDLSQHTDIAGDAAVLARLVVPPILPENEFAVRSTANGESKILVRRLTKSLAADMKSTFVPWQVSLDGDTFSVSELRADPSSEINRAQVDIDVQTFSVVGVGGATKAVVCGVVDAIHPDVDFINPGDKVVALCEGVVKRKLRLSSREIVRVPPNIGESADVLSQLDMFLPGLYLCNGGDILRSESKIAIYSQKNSDVECSVLSEVLQRQGQSVTVFTKETLTGKEGQRTEEIYDALIAMDADCANDTAIEGLLSAVRKFGTIVFYTSDDNEAVPSRGTLFRNKRLVLLNKSSIWETDEFPLLATRMFAILEDSGQKALPQFDARATWDRKQDLSATVGKAISDVANRKTVIVTDGKCPVPLSFDGNRFNPSGNAIYIVTGGMKGFGMATVKWLCSKGVKHVAIIGRSYATPEQKADISALEEVGCHIYVFKADVSNYSTMEVVIDNLLSKHHPIEGIFHSAAVFRDGWMTEMTQEDWMQVLMPKAYGALVLHQLSLHKNLPLQHFVTYSSIVGLVGNATQGNYCVANAFLLSLGDLRRSLGLPSSVACFGVINSTGFAYRNELVSMYDKKGMYSVSPENALNAVATMMSLNIDHLGITAAFDSNRFAEAFRGAMTQNEKIEGGFLSRFKYIMEGVTLGNAEGKALADRVREASADDGKEIVMEHLKSVLAKLLGINESDVSVDSSPVNLGVDSLMATDLSNNIMNAFDIQFLPVELLNDKTTLQSVCNSIYTKTLAVQGSVKIEAHIESGKTQTVSTWVRKMNNPLTVHAQIVCFPPNGGGATNFRNWPSYFEKHGCEMFLVQPPGWETRFTESPADDLQEIVKSSCSELTQLLSPDRFVFYGHSLGALLAFESAHYLKAKHNLCPRHLYVAAWSAPTIPYQHPQGVPQDVFEQSTPMHVLTSYVPRFTYLDPRLAANPTIMKRLRPCLAAGVKMCTAYSCRHADRLPCNITSLCGSSDLFAPSNKMAAWANMADQKYKHSSKTYRGAHMFLQDPDVNKTVLAKIKADMDKSRQKKAR